MAGRSHRTWGAVLTVVVMAGGLVAGVSPASAVVAATTGQVVKIAPPADVRPAGICSPTNVLVFDELQGVTLGAVQKVDYSQPGTYTSHLTMQKIPTGTVVDSHYLDNNGKCGTNTKTGTWKFSQDIVGVIVSRDALNDSDYLGNPTTEYGGGYPGREFSVCTASASCDQLTILPDGRTISVTAHAGGNVDQMRVLTKHNEPPVANAGGPYAGNEGSTVSLGGTASDPDGDPLTKLWTFATTASPGTVCSTTGTTTLTPTINCNDNAVVVATLSVTDGFHPAVTSVANVTIANKPPTITSFTVPTAVANGSPVNVSAVFADAGTHDTHSGPTTKIAWGDTTSSAPTTVNESGHTVTASHIYAGPGTYSITLTLDDDDGGTVTTAPKNVTVAGPPTTNTGGPYNGGEGSTIALSGSASSSLPISTTWAFTPGPFDPGTSCTYTGTTTLTPTVKCNDDLVIGATLTVSDGVNPPVVQSSSVAVDNVAPVLQPLTTNAGPFRAGDPVTVSGLFSDAGTNDAHTSTVDWGDAATTPATVSEALGAGSTTATHSYPLPGLYTVSVDVNDGDGGIATRTINVRVNTPPNADAGGPVYAGPEGTMLTLGGSASDVDPDTLSTTWSFSVAGAPASVCTFGATSTLSPTVLCTDNAVVTATLSVSDGVNPPVLSVATVLVNNIAPTLGTVTVPGSPVPLNTPVGASVPFSDVGTSDTHTATIDWGDTTSSAATIAESGGAGTASGSHTYSAPGTYTISITVKDDDLDSSTATATAVLIDGPPTADAGDSNGYSVGEGSPITLAGSASDPENDPLTISWSFAVAGSPGTACVSSDTSTLTPTIACNDDALVTATLSVKDPFNPVVTSDASILVYNVSPVLGPVVLSPTTLPLGGSVTVTVAFNDAGTNDTHTAQVRWSSTDPFVPMTVTESGGSGSATASQVYTAKGTFAVKVVLGDDDLDSVSPPTGTVKVT